MAETPDFETVALHMLGDLGVVVPAAPETRRALAVVAEHLRLAWNARGAADRAALRLEWTRALTAQRTDGSLSTDVEEALRSLDAVDPATTRTKDYSGV